MSAERLLEALRSESQGDWDGAHAVASESESPDAAWVHAYLHRREGDLGNAAYWYRRAGKRLCVDPLDEEREAITVALLRDGSR